jgi:CheY-like chemotaxis protein
VVIGDEARLRQVLLNLLNNAVKFTPKGQVTLRVERIGADESRSQLRFSVIDTGIGIPRDQRNRLFLRFAQIGHSTAGQYGGTGLGLAISKRLIELMGGIIGVESEEGRGSTFWIALVLPPAEAGVVHRVAAPPRRATRAARILVADDLEMNRELVCSMLEGVGHEVDAVSDAAEAIEAVKTKSYDLVLMDVRMRELTSGVMATKEIRRLPPPAGHVPIIAMTANVLPQQVREFKEAGMNDHLGKPFTWAQLLAKIALYLPENTPEDRGAAPAPDEAPSFDPQAYRQMTDLLGDERAQAWVERLKEQLDSIVGHGDVAGADQERLARRAHALVSQAGSIGFSAVSREAGELEQAWLAKADLKKPLGRLKAACRKALDQLVRLPGFSKHDREGVST